MSIRIKILVAILPLLASAVVLAGASSYFLAAAAVDRVARGLLAFKAEGLVAYAGSQWDLLVENDLEGRPDMAAASRAAVAAYARSLLRSPTEAVWAFRDDGGTDFAESLEQGGARAAGPADAAAVAGALAVGGPGFSMVRIAGTDRAAAIERFEPFGWTLVVSEEKAAFYGDVEEIGKRALAILGASVAAAAALVLVVTGYLTKPAEKVAAAMQRIVDSGDLSERVPVVFADEIGRVSHNFNLMLEALAAAHDRIKRYAFDAVVARKKENRIRNVFQLYVPKHVLDEVFADPGGMLVGTNRRVAILFSDIRGFTSISERMAPEDLVESLNRYFSTMVDIIMDRDGFVDKFIGDAIMAVFGAPVAHPDDALRATLAAIGMSEALAAFNANQERLGGPEFQIGVGVNYGVVTVGNIGCEKKMNYTVIGDMVNLASRLEGLTKRYKQGVLVSETTREAIGGALPFRLVDKVAVKGKSEGIRIYTTKTKLDPKEAAAWAEYGEAVETYYRRDFAAAVRRLEKIKASFGNDHLVEQFLERARAYAASPPPAGWDGVEVMTEK